MTGHWAGMRPKIWTDVCWLLQVSLGLNWLTVFQIIDSQRHVANVSRTGLAMSNKALHYKGGSSMFQNICSPSSDKFYLTARPEILIYYDRYNHSDSRQLF